jgi:hypothetical protein
LTATIGASISGGSIAGTITGAAFTVRVAPTLTTLSYATWIIGNAVTETLTGTNFVAGATTIALSGTGVTVSSVNVASSTSLTATFTVAGGAALVAQNVTVTTAGGTSAAQPFTPAAGTIVSAFTDAAPGAPPGSGAGVAGDLRHAIINSNPGDTIVFNCAAPPCTITLGGPLPPITHDLTIDGGTFGNLVVDGNSLYRAFWADSGTVTLHALHIQNVLAQGGAPGSRPRAAAGSEQARGSSFGWRPLRSVRYIFREKPLPVGPVARDRGRVQRAVEAAAVAVSPVPAEPRARPSARAAAAAAFSGMGHPSQEQTVATGASAVAAVAATPAERTVRAARATAARRPAPALPPAEAVAAASAAVEVAVAPLLSGRPADSAAAVARPDRASSVVPAGDRAAEVPGMAAAALFPAAALSPRSMEAPVQTVTARRRPVPAAVAARPPGRQSFSSGGALRSSTAAPRPARPPAE